MIHRFLYRCFQIRSDWTDSHYKLVKLMDLFKNYNYPENFINNCFKKFLHNKDRILDKMILVLRYLGPLLLQTRTKLRNSIKGILNCCKLQIVFNIKNNLSNTFCFKDHIPKELTSGFVHKFQCGLCNQYYYGECVRHLNVRFVEHTAISLLTKKKVKPKGSAVNVQL